MRIEELQSDIAAAQSEIAKLKAHAKAMAAMIKTECINVAQGGCYGAMDDYDRDFPEDGV